MSTEGFPRPFVLQRNEDVTGVSGTGVVAWGVEFPDGVVALRWNSEWPTSVVFHDKGMDAVNSVHGHGGATEVLWADYAPREEWGGFVWSVLVDEALAADGRTPDPNGQRVILHRLTPAITKEMQ